MSDYYIIFKLSYVLNNSKYMLINLDS